uniref:Uncharacterized protein n=1 Tax=Parascaris univalens TaxID=6257 RepID=A0A915A4Q8_PARUN
MNSAIPARHLSTKHTELLQAFQSSKWIGKCSVTRNTT